MFLDDVTVYNAVPATIGSGGAASPTLTAAAGATVDGPFDITFTDDATWRGAITGITVGGATLSSSAYVTTAAGKISFTPSLSTLLQSSGIKDIVVLAGGYSNATVSQTIAAGAATKLAMVTQPTAPLSNGAALNAQPVVRIQDQYGNTTTSTASVTATVGSGTWTLGGTSSIAGVAGTATFSGLTATSAAAVTGATIDFASSGLTGISSNSFIIVAPAVASLTSTYSESFDSIGTFAITPTGWLHMGGLGGTNSSWFASIPSSGSPSAATTGAVNNSLVVNSDAASATANSDSLGYNFALSGSTGDRCIGTSPTSGAGNILQLRLANNTGAPLSAIQISYDIRRFTAGGSAPQLPGYQLFYSSDDGTTWTNASALNPTLTEVPNSAGVTSIPLSSVTLSSAVGNGSELRLRWVDDNDTASPDQIIGLDNVTVIPSLAPTVATGTSGSVTTSSATITGNDVTADGGAPIIERGVVFATTANPTIASPGKVTVAGTTGLFDANLTALAASTFYYARAYATNAVGTTYGADVNFTTLTPSGTIVLGGSVSARSGIYGTASTAASFTVSGTSLAGDLTVVSPVGFEVSLTEGSGYAGSVPITASGTLSATTVYVRLAETTVPGDFSGDVVVSGGDAAAQALAIPVSTVSVKPLTLTDAAVTTRPYNGTTSATITGTLDGVVGSDVVGFTGTGTFASANVGTGISVTASVALTGADANRYSITQPTGLTGEITIVGQTITFAALPTKTIGDGPFSLTATATSGLAVSYESSNTAVATVAGSTVTIVGVGTTIITASQTGSVNYAAAADVVQSLEVIPQPLALFEFPASNSLLASSMPANVTVSNVALSTGTIETNITTGTYFPNEPYVEETGGWAATTQATAKNFNFTVTAASGYTFTITNISFRAYATAAGPAAFGFGIDGTDLYAVDAPSAALVEVSQSVTGQTDLSTATISIQGWLNGSRTSAGSGVFRLDDIVITGTVTPIPTSAYATWSSGALFDSDSNNDGVKSGMAWLLGAASPTANATGLLPSGSQDTGKLVMNFTCLKVAGREGAVLKLQYSKDLGLTDPWTSHEAVVPDTDGTVNGVVFTTSANANTDLINIQAEIPASAASPGTKLFGRLNAVSAP